MLLKLIVGVTAFVAASNAVPGCVPRDFGHGSTVCVCNSTYCDIVEPTTADQLSSGVLRHYVSTKAGKRLEPMTMKFSPSTTTQDSGTDVTFTVNRKSRYQEMFGFGGAATDSATMNTYSLSSAAAEKLIRSYFAKEGIGYSFIRVPMGGSDFSTHDYAYTDDYPYDTTLQHFNLSVEDYNYKIPFIKRATELSPYEVKLFTAAWGAPKWMKYTDGSVTGGGLKEEYFQVYANYNKKFLDFYAAQGLKYWGMTPQNEPLDNIGREQEPELFDTKEAFPRKMMNYLVGNLCPTLKSGGYSGLKVMINDNLRNKVNYWLQLYKNSSILECASGMTVHWYLDTTTSPDILTEAHKQYPEKFLLYAEACIVHDMGVAPVTLGSWENGEKYMTDLIEVTNHWVTGWVDWNMALDPAGGPNYINNTVDSPVIVNATSDEFYKQPMFYALAHFSKFVPPGSVRIGLESEQDGGIENVAFLTPDNITVVIMQNKADKEVKAVLSDPDSGSASFKIPARSMHTVLFK